MDPRPPDVTDPDGVQWTWARLHDDNYGVYVLADPEALVEMAVENAESDAPYFGTVWPSGRVLADEIRAGRVPLGKTVCDLGSGAGVVGLAVSWAGHESTCVDFAARGFFAVRAAAAAMSIAEPACVTADWELDTLPNRFDSIVAADILYHSHAVAPVARWVERHLEPGGVFYLADPGRRTAQGFPDAATAAGLVPEPLPDPVVDSYTGTSVMIMGYRKSKMAPETD